MIDPHRLNEARWAACNSRYPTNRVPTIEEATALADRIVCAFLGLTPEEFHEQVGANGDD